VERRRKQRDQELERERKRRRKLAARQRTKKRVIRSIFLGVEWDPESAGWAARLEIPFGGDVSKSLCLGLFRSDAEAAHARDAAAVAVMNASSVGERWAAARATMETHAEDLPGGRMPLLRALGPEGPAGGDAAQYELNFPALYLPPASKGNPPKTEDCVAQGGSVEASTTAPTHSDVALQNGDTTADGARGSDREAQRLAAPAPVHGQFGGSEAATEEASSAGASSASAASGLRALGKGSTEGEGPGSADTMTTENAAAMATFGASTNSATPESDPALDPLPSVSWSATTVSLRKLCAESSMHSGP
jgi:hypothetical protein